MKILLLACFLFAFLLVPQPCGANNRAVMWAKEAMKLAGDSMTVGNFPLNIRYTVRQRIEASMSTAMYVAFSAYKDKAMCPYSIANLRATIPGSNSNMEESIDYAAFGVLKHELRFMDASLTTSLVAKFVSLGRDPLSQAANMSTAAGIGIRSANVVNSYFNSDGTNSAGDAPSGTAGVIFSDHTGYTPINDPMPTIGMTNCDLLRNINKWQQALQLSPAGTPVVQKLDDAHFSNYRTFSMPTAYCILPEPPYMYGTPSQAAFIAEYDSLLQVAAVLNDTLKAEAEFWQFFASQRQMSIDAAEIANLNLESTIKYFFVSSHAVLDATAAVYATKKVYEHARPTSIIQCLYKNQSIVSWKGPYQGVGNINGSEFTAYHTKRRVTNTGPEYPCGHCMITGAWLQANRHFFGNDTFYGKNFTLLAGKSVNEPKIDNPLDPNYVSGLTNVANTGPSTQGYSPATDITVNFEGTWTGVQRSVNRARKSLLVHVDKSIEVGTNLGVQIGTATWDRARKLFDGVA